MKLTGKAKAKFKEWYKKEYNPNNWGWMLEEFYNLPKAMQWGVYQDWADSLGYSTMVLSNGLGKFYYKIYRMIDLLDVFEDFKVYNTRQEARNAAIEKLNELINEG